MALGVTSTKRKKILILKENFSSLQTKLLLICEAARHATDVEIETACIWTHEEWIDFCSTLAILACFVQLGKEHRELH